MVNRQLRFKFPVSDGDGKGREMVADSNTRAVPTAGAHADIAIPPQPITESVVAKRHRALYRMHRYYARRPWNVFAGLVDHYSREGDLILDPFAGGGVTLVEGVLLGRRTIGFDTNPLATFLTSTELAELDGPAFEVAVEKVIEMSQHAVAPLYEVECSSCLAVGPANWLEYSLLVDCETCGARFPTSSAEKVAPSTWQCTICKSPVKGRAEHGSQFELVSTHPSCECGVVWARPRLTEERLKEEVDNFRKENPGLLPDAPIPECNMERESALHSKGFIRFDQLFTNRQLLALGEIKRAIASQPPDLLPWLWLGFSSTLRYANRMVTRNPGWRGERPLEWVGTGYWLPASFLDANPAVELHRRYERVVKGKKEFSKLVDGRQPVPFKDAFDIVDSNGSGWFAETRSSTSMPLPDESVDSIVTDPPYGSYVHYSDLSNFYSVWLDGVPGMGEVIDPSEEAVISRKRFPGAKDSSDYELLLEKVFSECHRVLKPSRWMVLTFHNREPRAWVSLLVAAVTAGFRMPANGVIFQPGVENYKHTARSRRKGSVRGDFIVSFVKPASSEEPGPSISDAKSPLDEKDVVERLASLLSNGPLTPTELFIKFYTSLLPVLADYIANAVKGQGAIQDLLEEADDLDLFDSHRRQLLEDYFHYDGDQWSLLPA